MYENKIMFISLYFTINTFQVYHQASATYVAVSYISVFIDSVHIY